MPQNMASFDRVLLIGASGLLGKAIQNALLMNKGKFEKLGVLTSSSALPNPSKDEYWASLRARGVEIIKVDFGDNDALVKAFSGWDAVISAVGLALVKTQLPMVEAAAVARVKRFLPSDFGFDLTNPSNMEERVYAMKLAVARKLRDIAHHYPNFTYTFLTIGSFAAFPFLVPAVFDLDFEECTANIIGDGEAQISFTSTEDVAAFAVAVLRKPDDTKNTTIRVQGTTASWNEVIQILEKVQKKKYAVTYESIQDARRKETQYWESGNPLAARYALRRIMAEGNAKLPMIQNHYFPEVKVTTDLEQIVKNVLRNKGIV